MRLLASVLVVGPLLAGGLTAQNPMQRQMLERRVMQRWMENYRMQAGLDDAQFERFREITQQSFAERAQIQRQERELWRALEGQMRPGIGADADSVTNLLDALVAVQQAMLEQTKADQAAYAEILTPVQRAQLWVVTRRLQQNIEGIMRRRGRDRM